MSFRENLLRLRTEHNMTQEQLATLIGVSRQSVAKWESDRSYPEMDKLIKMTGIFGCTLDELVMGPADQEACDDAALLQGGALTEDAAPHFASAEEPEVFASQAAAIPVASSSAVSAASAASAVSAPAFSAPATDVYGYDAHMRSFAKRIAWGVASIILGVALMIAAEGMMTLSAGYPVESAAILLFLLVGLGVGLLLIIPAATQHSAFMRARPVIRDFYTAEEKRRAGSQLAYGIVGGIALIFLSVVALDYGTGSYAVSATSMLGAGVESHIAFEVADLWAVGLMLVLIAAAVWCFIYFGIMYSRVHVREYNGEALDELIDAYGDGTMGVETLLSDLSPEERQLLFDSEGIDGANPDQVREFFNMKRRKSKLLGGVCSIIMIVATIVGLCLMFGIPTFSPFFWMAWVVGGLVCAIASVVVNTFVK